MEYRAFFCVALVLIAADLGQTRSIIILRERNLKDVGNLQLTDPTDAKGSAGVILYKLNGHDILHGNYNFQKNITLSAPKGYGLFISINFIDFRPKSMDTLTLSVPGMNIQKTYTNEGDNQNIQTAWNNQEGQFYSPNGKVEVSFKTVGATMGSTTGFYDGFKFTYTVQGNVTKPETCKTDFFKCQNGRCIADALKCNKEMRQQIQHCGDGSDHTHEACYPITIPPGLVSLFPEQPRNTNPPPRIVITLPPEIDNEVDNLVDNATTAVGTIIGIVFGVIIALILVGGLIAFLILRRSSQRSRTPGYVR